MSLYSSYSNPFFAYLGGAALGIGPSPAQAAALAQTSWSVDASIANGGGGTGNDANDGSPGAPLATLNEITRRWGYGTITAATVDITYTGNLDWSVPFVSAARGTVVRVHGTTTVVRSGTLTAATASNPAGNLAWILADGATVWTADVGRVIRNTTVGARLNASSGVGVDLGAGTVRVSGPITFNVTGGPANTFALGDTYNIETKSSIRLGGFYMLFAGGGGGITFDNTQFGFVIGDTGSMHIKNGSAEFFNCSNVGSSFLFDGDPGYINQFDNWIGRANTAIVNGLPTFNGGLFTAGLIAQNGADFIAVKDCLFQGTGFVQTAPGSRFRPNKVGGFDSTSSSFRIINQGGCLQTGPLYGTSAAATLGGVRIDQGCFLLSTSSGALTVTGSAPGTNDFTLGALTASNTFDPATGLFAAPAIAHSWANWLAARPAGFGSHLVNVTNQATITI